LRTCKHETKYHSAIDFSKESIRHMKADNFDLSAYCKRIGFSGQPRSDLATVRELMRRQLYSVPFENLDVLAGKGVSLVPEEIVDKIVHRQRGGYCYEVNGLFAMVLEALGIPYRFIACRPMIYPMLRPRTHMALIALIEGDEWLCDLGFGSYGIRAPLRLGDAGREIRQDHEHFMLERTDEQAYLLKARVDGEWANQYGFDLWPQQWIDFMPANYLNSNHPEAIFVQKLVVLLQHPEGRTLLFGDRLKQVQGDHSEVSLVSQEAIGALLRDTFGLSAPDAGLDA
jgi:N-hydroxyarylamine O-acetyltransferase